METGFLDGMNVHCIQEDKYVEGNLLLSVVGGIVTWSPDNSTRFIYRSDLIVYSFQQHNSSLVIVADSFSDCLRGLPRDTMTVTTLSGRCSPQRLYVSKDGTISEAAFNQPTIIIEGRSNNEYYLTEPSGKGGAVRRVDLSAEFVSTVLRGKSGDLWTNPWALAQDPTKQMIYISTLDDIYQYDYQTETVKNLTSGEAGSKDGPLAKSQITSPVAMTFLTDNLLLMLMDNSLRLVDLQDESVTSLKLAPRGPMRHSLLHMPSERKIYIGSREGITSLACEYKY